MADIIGIDRRENKENRTYKNLTMGIIPNIEDAPVRYKILIGKLEHKEKGVPTGEISRMYDKSRYKFFLDAPFNISAQCCKVMKKRPIHKYAKATGRKPMTAQMACESRLRTQKWLQAGCNAFDSDNPISNPLSFWTEQDILAYIVKYDLQICSVYGDIVEDYGNDIDGQMTLADYGFFEKEKRYKTTGCERTGCMLCGFGCHLEKCPNRLQKLKETHPGMYGLLDKVKNSGVTMREAIDWTNEHGNLSIKY